MVSPKLPGLEIMETVSENQGNFMIQDFLVSLIGNTINRQPLLPTFIHDDNTRIILMTILLLSGIGILHRVMVNYGR